MAQLFNGITEARTFEAQMHRLTTRRKPCDALRRMHTSSNSLCF